MKISWLGVIAMAIYGSSLCLRPAFAVEQDVKVNILAVNPSKTNKIISPISQLLPPEIKPEDIIDAGGMEIKYDAEKKAHYLTHKIELEPLETKTIVVKIKNVWVVPEEEISTVTQQLDESVKSLVDTEYAETAQLLQEKVNERIAEIQDSQTKEVGILRRIERYRTHMRLIQEIKDDVISLESMRKMKEEKEQGMRTVKFVVKAENPADSIKKMSVKAFLPQDITADDLVDKLDFDLLYDERRKRFFVEKLAEFGPKEVKKFELTLRDIWYIPETDIAYLRDQGEKLMRFFNSSNYEGYAQQALDFINMALDEVTALQTEVASSESIEERARAFVLNTKRVDAVKKKIKELQDLLLQIPLKKEISQMDKIKQAIKKILNVTDILKLGFKPDLSTTWWIILGIIAFILILSATFYVTWLTKLKDAKLVKGGQKKTKQSKEPAPGGTEPPGAKPGA